MPMPVLGGQWQFYPPPPPPLSEKKNEWIKKKKRKGEPVRFFPFISFSVTCVSQLKNRRMDIRFSRAVSHARAYFGKKKKKKSLTLWLPGVYIWETCHSKRTSFIRKRNTFAHYNLSLSTSTCFTDHENTSKRSWDTEKFAKSRLKEKRARIMRTN